MTRVICRGSTRLKLDREESAMVGNVWEFCAQDLDTYPSALVDTIDPVGPAVASLAVSRGGGFAQRVEHYCSAPRFALTRTGRDNEQGFRVVLDVSGPR